MRANFSLESSIDIDEFVDDRDPDNHDHGVNDIEGRETQTQQKQERPNYFPLERITQILR